MSIFPFLQLQPLEPSDDGTVSDLDTFQPDEVIDLSDDVSEAELEAAWDNLASDIHESHPEKQK